MATQRKKQLSDVEVQVELKRFLDANNSGFGIPENATDKLVVTVGMSLLRAFLDTLIEETQIISYRFETFERVVNPDKISDVRIAAKVIMLRPQNLIVIANRKNGDNRMMASQFQVEFGIS